ncbi:MAG: DUF6455 family protein [Planctomycetota bacterium]|jgi:hypothetical protein
MDAASEKRMVMMLERVGLGPAIALNGKADTILECVIETSIKEIRQRCRVCKAKDACERWLAGNEHGDNDFCPNAKIIDELKIIFGDAA